MALNIGTRLGSYDIVAALGAGGMGEVYRARDTKLGREIAIKILPEAFASDPQRVSRFQREAQLLAALNHPHIGAIYGLEQSKDTHFLVLELIDGESLDARLKARARVGFPTDEALEIARQIVAALEAAHEKGIIHRDLKPANIMLTTEGQVKVLDFGLAKALEAEGRPDPSHSPTLTFQATQEGVVLGTAAYMSPEQAKGRVADKRCDVWAFGCVLYEMLTGRRAFEGEDVSDTLAAILRAEPDWNALPPDVPPHIRAVIRRCLEKDRKARIPDISVVRFLMNDAPSPAPIAIAAARVSAGGRRRVVAGTAAGLAAGVAATAIGMWAVARLSPRPSPPLVRFAIQTSGTLPLLIQGSDRDLAISPDGRHIVYRAGPDEPRLVMRALNDLDARPLAGNVAARAPFFSADGRWIGFSASGELRKVSVTGGPAIPVHRSGGPPRGATWGPDDAIVFATGDPATGLQTVPAGGGEARALTTPDQARGEADHYFPSILPGGQALLFTITAAGQSENAQVAVLDLSTGKHKTLIRGGSQAEYLESGHIVYAAGGVLRAVRFDLGRLEVLGDSVPVVDGVMTASASGAANFAVSRTGTLVFVPGGAGFQNSAQRSLVWVDRQGREEALKLPPRAYTAARVSPDGTRIALEIRDQENDIWAWELGRQTLTRLTFDPNPDMSPVWMPDSKRVIFASPRYGVPNLFWHAADGTGEDARLTTGNSPQFPTSASADGSRVLLFEMTPRTNTDIALLLLGGAAASRAGPSTQPGAPAASLGAGPPTPPGTPAASLGAGAGRVETLLQTTFAESNPEISSDGRWIAYQSNESGRTETLVRPLPKLDDGRWQVSTTGGTRPLFARNGRELFYIDGNGALTVVPVQTTGATFSAGNAVRLLDARSYAGNIQRTYDVSADGHRFLMIKDVGTADQATTSPSMVVVINWLEELKTKVAGSGIRD